MDHKSTDSLILKTMQRNWYISNSIKDKVISYQGGFYDKDDFLKRLASRIKNIGEGESSFNGMQNIQKRFLTEFSRLRKKDANSDTREIEDTKVTQPGIITKMLNKQRSILST